MPLSGSPYSTIFFKPDLPRVKETDELTPIQSFFDGASVFVTGATGFLGKLLVEKLLRSCPTVATIYVLVRNKKGKDMPTRIDELLADVVFDRLRSESTQFKHKIVGIAGDCTLPDLGLSIEDRQLIIDEVSVIFHVAATVRFDEHLKTAMAINVRSPLDLIRLGREMKHLKSFVHVSTAFSNCPNSVIEEKFYPVPMDSQKLLTVVDNLPDDFIDTLTPAVLGKWPNTYAFTKAVAEDVIKTEGIGLPIAVYRPSIVVSTYREPVRAWINNLYGPTGVVAGAGTGLVRALHCDDAVNANIVPADMVVNSMVACAWEAGVTHRRCLDEHRPYAMPVYNFESSTDRPMTWRRYMDCSWEHGEATPTMRAVWYTSINMFSSRAAYLLAIVFLHYLPALMIDAVMLCVGKAPKMMAVYKKIHKFTNVISYFATRTFKFESYKIQEMIGRMSERDRELFFCDLKKLDWTEYFQHYIKGLRVFLLNDPLETVEVARIKWRRLFWAHQLVKALAFIIVIRILWFIFSTIKDLF